MAKKRAVLATFGTLGDINPFIAIATTLNGHGIEPTIVAPDTYRSVIEREGFCYARLRPSMPDVAAALGVDIPGAFRIMLGNPHFILDEIYLRSLRETYEDVLAASAGADVILTHSLLVGATQAAEALHIPAARITLAPLHLQTAASPPVTPGAPYRINPKSRAAVSYNRIVRRIVRAVTNARMGRLRGFRLDVGLPATNEDFFLDFGRANTADTVFGLFSPLFSPKQPDHPTNLVVAGFPFQGSTDLERGFMEPALEAFLEAGEPPIVFTLGSFAPEVSGNFYDQSLHAARNLGFRAVLLAGARDAARLATKLSNREFVCASAPHALLFPCALCVVHHGGIGTTAETMRAGKPQLVVPFFGDQPDHGARVTRLGLGLALTLADYNEKTACEGIARILAASFRCAATRFAKSISDEGGVEMVAEWVVRRTRMAQHRPQL